ncbi:MULTISPECIES: hypothetical protein [unclassified Corynebacterium]|uniref:hypothetical protein n=1 Tax=unclassified Corynebacterium TaxID=2624378 RepID=UPI0029C9B381|nr:MULTISPECIES: hypothetical protein [unclassified Corynebacterium]WPF66639.1 hypothetical protein OLX12_02585 [Corynebacterium sp. 22KM0430]WPF69127.1 hypothetical protein OLW90_02580 [Corynebacterium sp. 21KM1197]
MSKDTRKVMAFIAVGILAAAAIGFLVWRVSIPSGPAPQAQPRHSAAADATSLTPTSSEKTREEHEDTEGNADADDAPATLAAAQRRGGHQRQPEEALAESPTVLRAEPTKIYRPDSVSAQRAENTDQAADTLLAQGARGGTDAVPTASTPVNNPRAGAEAVAPASPSPTDTASAAQDGTANPTEDGRRNNLPVIPEISEALEHAQEELSQLPGASLLPLDEETRTEEPEGSAEPEDTAAPATQEPVDPAGAEDAEPSEDMAPRRADHGDADRGDADQATWEKNAQEKTNQDQASAEPHPTAEQPAEPAAEAPARTAQATPTSTPGS